MKYVSICSGIEAATVAWHPLGWEPLAFCEIDRFPSRVLAHHYPGVPNLGDFTEVDWSQYPADLLVGGTPCQAFSVAGLRKSLDDARGNLSLEFIRAANTIRPRFIVWENVPGVLSTSDNAFGCFLAGLVGCEEPIVFEQGWPNAGVVDGPERRCAWRVLDAQYFGLAQRRRRVFVVASSGDGPHPAEILFEWDSMRRDSPPRREAGEGAAGTIAARTRGGGGLGTDFDCDGSTVAMCLNAKGGGGRLDGESETLVTHSLRADGFDASEDGTGRGTPLVAVGIQAGALRENPDSGQDGVGVQEHIAYTLEARAEVQAVEFSCKDHGADAGAISPTLRSMGHDGSHANGGGQVAVATGFYPTGGTHGVNSVHECSPAVKIGTSSNSGNPPGVQHGMAVRRLTPRECERLQGFPDDYTLIHGAADGPRYKALGNSMAVPVMRWIGERIEAAR